MYVGAVYKSRSAGRGRQFTQVRGHDSEADKMDSLLVLLPLLAIASAKIPKGYILDVTPTCTSNKADATVVITSDLNVKAVFSCSGAKYTETIDETKTKISFKIHYSDKKDKKCFFKNPSATSNVYMVTLELYWGEPGASASHQIHTQKEIYKIVCTTGGQKSVASQKVNIGNRPFAPEQKGSNKGAKSGASMSLVLYDALDQALTAKNVAIGKKVYLKGWSTGAKAIVPVDCEAISSKQSYQILRGGCGDGIVFKTDKGFTAKGKTTTSPVFGFFKFPTGSTVSFKCTFIECTTTTCLLRKDSCVSRKRRSIEDSRPLDVFKPDQKAISKIIKMSADYTTGRNEDFNTFPGKVLIVYSSPPPAAEPRLKGTEDREYTMIMFAILSCFTAVSLIVSLYMCTKQGRYRSELSNVKA